MTPKQFTPITIQPAENGFIVHQSEYTDKHMIRVNHIFNDVDDLYFYIKHLADNGDSK